MGKLLTCHEIADRYDVSVWTVYRAIEQLTDEQRAKIERVGRYRMVPAHLARKIAAQFKGHGHAEYEHECWCGRVIVGNAYYQHARACKEANRHE